MVELNPKVTPVNYKNSLTHNKGKLVYLALVMESVWEKENSGFTTTSHIRQTEPVERVDWYLPGLFSSIKTC